MKQFVKTIAVIALTLGSANLVQAQKIGHIQLDSLIGVMAESKTAQEVAQKHLKSLESELMTMQTEFEKKMNEFTTNRDKGTWSSLILEMKQKELEQMSQNIETYKGSAQQDYQAKLASVSKPVYDKARKAIEMVAKEGGYKYILDSSGGSLVYSEPGDDVFGAVKKKLESLPTAVIPGATSAGTTTPVKTPTPGAGTKPAGGK